MLGIIASFFSFGLIGSTQKTEWITWSVQRCAAGKMSSMFTTSTWRIRSVCMVKKMPTWLGYIDGKCCHIYHTYGSGPWDHLAVLVKRENGWPWNISKWTKSMGHFVRQLWVSLAEGTPSHHPCQMGIFPYKNHPAMRVHRNEYHWMPHLLKGQSFPTWKLAQVEYLRALAALQRSFLRTEDHGRNPGTMRI